PALSSSLYMETLLALWLLHAVPLTGPQFVPPDGGCTTPAPGSRHHSSPGGPGTKGAATAGAGGSRRFSLHPAQRPRRSVSIPSPSQLTATAATQAEGAPPPGPGRKPVAPPAAAAARSRRAACASSSS